MKRERKGEPTRIVWDARAEALVCEACGAVLQWNFGFRRCPYCGRKVVWAEERRAEAMSRRGGGAIIR